MNKQLGAVSREFEMWRTYREKRTHTPKALIAKAVALRDSYSDAQIVKTLKINSSTLKQWIKRESATSAEAFIELPTLTAGAQAQISLGQDTDERPRLHIGLLSGATLTISGSDCVLANFVAKLTALSRCASNTIGQTRAMVRTTFLLTEQKP